MSQQEHDLEEMMLPALMGIADIVESGICSGLDMPEPFRLMAIAHHLYWANYQPDKDDKLVAELTIKDLDDLDSHSMKMGELTSPPTWPEQKFLCASCMLATRLRYTLTDRKILKHYNVQCFRLWRKKAETQDEDHHQCEVQMISDLTGRESPAPEEVRETMCSLILFFASMLPEFNILFALENADNNETDLSWEDLDFDFTDM